MFPINRLLSGIFALFKLSSPLTFTSTSGMSFEMFKTYFDLSRLAAAQSFAQTEANV